MTKTAMLGNYFSGDLEFPIVYLRIFYKSLKKRDDIIKLSSIVLDYRHQIGSKGSWMVKSFRTR